MKTRSSIFAKMGLVARHELITTLQRKAVLFTMFGLPLISILVLAGLNRLSQPRDDGSGSGENAAASLLEDFAFGGNDPAALEHVGIVDETGRIDTFPDEAEGFFIIYDSLDDAARAYEAGTIFGYYQVPADYLASGEVFLFANEQGFLFEIPDRLLNETPIRSFVDAPPEIETRIVFPLALNRVDVAVTTDAPVDDQAFESALGIGTAVSILFFVTTMGSAGYLLQSLGQEKENRVIEILLSSIRPFELFMGKMIGLGIVGLIQVLVWGVIAVFLFRGGSGGTADLVGNLSLPIIAPRTWLIVGGHFVTGYFMYASLFAALGAIAPSPKESSQYTFFVILPVLVPMIFSSAILASPNSNFAIGLSLFPLTSPVAMSMRLVITSVPVWQWLLSLSGGVVGALLLIAAVTRVFRAQSLLSGQSLTLRRIVRAFR